MFVRPMKGRDVPGIIVIDPEDRTPGDWFWILEDLVYLKVVAYQGETVTGFMLLRETTHGYQITAFVASDSETAHWLIKWLLLLKTNLTFECPDMWRSQLIQSGFNPLRIDPKILCWRTQ